MISEIITVGTELLIGSVINTNGPYLSRKLTDYGYDVLYHSSIQDKSSDIEEALKTALKRSDIIFLSGGMGPTKDDMTKEIVAKTLGLGLSEDAQAWEKIKKRLSTYSEKFTMNNRKQAQIIDGSKIIPNPHGSAPGDFIEYNGKKIFLLPGPPREFEPMADYIIDKFLRETNVTIFMESLNLVLIGESACETIVRQLDLEDENIEINTFAKLNEVEVKVIAHSAKKEDYQKIKNRFNEVIEILSETFKDNLYSLGQTSLEKELVDRLIENGETLSFAESITGGLLSSYITSVPKSSKVEKYGFVTYSKEAKEKVLGVSRNTIDQYGVVSQEVAREMALGCQKLTNSTYAISTTGEAGPDPAGEKIVGTLCYSIVKDGVELANAEVHLNGNRQVVQARAAKYVLSKLILIILGGNHGK